MQFKYPEILYALFLLLIPIFIHLFQLRRFQKIDFTNVAFLRKVTLQTRKSSVIKKWLTLMMRLLALACLVIAFAQPFKPKDQVNSEQELVLYIDNSFSTQAKGTKGSLLEGSIQDLFNGFSAEHLSWFTNNSESQNVSGEDFKNDVLNIRPTAAELSPNEVLLKANQFFSKRKDTRKKLLYISDFRTKEAFPEIPNNLEVEIVQLKPTFFSNIAIDSAFIKSKNAGTAELQVTVSTQGETPDEVPVSLFKNDELVAKTGIKLEKNSSETVPFDLDISEGFTGKITITEPHITFDNTLYFSINKTDKINVLSINEADSNFLNRLFDSENFNLLHSDFNQLEYHRLPEQNFIILNQVRELPGSLVTALQSYLESGGGLLIIPSSEADITSYNSLLSNINLGLITAKMEEEKKITRISFSHPLFSDVFEKEIQNFQYPKVNSFYEFQSNATPVLQFEDGRPFLLQSKSVYLFSAALDSENSNFRNSPLIVPTFYSMGLQSLPLPDLYFTIGEQNTFAIPVQMGPDEILTLAKDDKSFIPMQQTRSNYVEITTTDLPEEAGNYEIWNRDERVRNISYNYNRVQGKLNYADPSAWEGAVVHKNISDLLFEISNENSTHPFWKWFAIFAFVFLISEMAILKFFK